MTGGVADGSYTCPSKLEIADWQVVMMVSRIAYCAVSDYYYLRPRSLYRLYLLPGELAGLIQSIPQSLERGQLVSLPAENESGLHFLAVIPDDHRQWVTFDDVPVSTESGTVEIHLGCCMTSRSARDFRLRALKARREYVGQASSPRRKWKPYACFGYAQFREPLLYALEEGLDPHSGDVEFHFVPSYEEKENILIEKHDMDWVDPSSLPSLRQFGERAECVYNRYLRRFEDFQADLEEIRRSARRGGRSRSARAGRADT